MVVHSLYSMECQVCVTVRQVRFISKSPNVQLLSVACTIVCLSSCESVAKCTMRAIVCRSSPSAWREKAARLRSVVSDVLPVDVHQASPLTEGTLPPSGADCLVSSFCLESVSPDLPCFMQALRHIGSLLRPGGCLLLIGALGETYYMGGPGVRIPVVPLDETQVCASLRASGYLLIQLCVYILPADMKVGVDDVTGIFYVKAKKAVG